MSYTMSYIRLARTGQKRTISYVFWRYRTWCIRCRIKKIRCRIRHRMRCRTYDGQEQYFDIRYRMSNIRYRMRYRIRYIHKQKLFWLHHNTFLFLQARLHLFLIQKTVTRIQDGIRMTKWTLLISMLLLLAPWHTTPDYRIPLPVFSPLFRTGVSWTKWRWTTRSKDCQFQS
jgi:hypothetical protein